MSTEKETKPASQQVPTGRFARLSKLGGTATTVGARTAFQKLKDAVTAPEDRAASRRQASARNAQDVVKTLSEMKGAAMKVGQLLSVDPQMLPSELRNALATLQKDAPPMPFEQVEREVTTALGMPLAQAFTEFAREPLGAASIGQVHRAVTKAGQHVAVKVQYPGIADTIDSDVKNLGSVLQMARLVMQGQRIDEYLEEFRQVLHREADYLEEARNLTHYGEILKVFPYARVPAPVMELTRRNVITMELMEGRPLDQVLLSLPAVERDALAARFLSLFMRMFHELSTLHADPHPGNFLVDAEGNIVLLDFGCVRTFDATFVDGITNLMRAQWRGDAESLPGLYRTMGFTVPDGKGIDGPMLYEWHEIVLEPLIKDVVFDFSSWQLEKRAIPYVMDNLALKFVAPPRPALFYFRVCAGLRGMLSRTGAQVNVAALAHDLDKRLRAVGR